MSFPIIAALGAVVISLIIWKLFFKPIVPEECKTFLNIPADDDAEKWGKFIGSGPPNFLLHRHFESQAKKHGKVFRRRVLTRNVVVVADKELGIKLLKDKETFVDRPYTGIAYFVPLGLLGLPTGEQWHNHRKHISPLFSDRFMKIFSEDVLVRQTYVLISQLEKAIENSRSVNLHDLLSRISLDVIGLTGFGCDFHAVNDNEENEYMSASTGVLNSCLFLTTMPNWLYSLILPQMSKAGEKGIQLFRDVVRRTSQEFATQEFEARMVTQLHKAGLSEQELVDELTTLVLAGHETTANAMTWAFMLLAQHQEALKKMLEDIDALYNEPDFNEANLWDYIKQDKLPYVKAVMYETLRLYPSVPIVPRVCKTHTQLGEWTLPAGTNVFVSLFAMHRHPDNFSDPDVFKPERFYKNEGLSDAFYPFGNGVRICIGRRFALIESIIVLAMLHRRFEFQLVKDQNIEERSHITLTPRHGMHFVISSRNL